MTWQYDRGRQTLLATTPAGIAVIDKFGSRAVYRIGSGELREAESIDAAKREVERLAQRTREVRP